MEQIAGDKMAAKAPSAGQHTSPETWTDSAKAA